MTVGSLFAGIGGFDLGFGRAGMRVLWQVENDPRCREVLERRFDAKIYGAVETFALGTDRPEPVDLVCGGFPCQDISVAGRREGLAGVRSGLWFEMLRVLGVLAPEWVVVENTPALLSSRGGRDFERVLSGLADCGYGVCWRVLDSRWFGVPQRRRRLYVVGSLGDGCAAQVLLDADCLRGSAEKGGAAEQDDSRLDETAPRSRGVGTDCAYALKGDGNPKRDFADNLVWQEIGGGGVSGTGEVVGTLRSSATRNGFGVGMRKLTPTEWGRLQGFPDRFNDWLPDTVRYRQFGNAVTVNVAAWLGQRILDAQGSRR